MESSEFMKTNKEGGAKVKTLSPSTRTLSEADADFMLQIAAGEMMQLEASKLAMKMAVSEDARTIAKAEVEEQTGLSAKLKEFAAAAKLTLPDAPDKKTHKLLEKLQGKSGADFDRAYLDESGLEGHEMLKDTMTKVNVKAEDEDLKALAMPLCL